MGSRRNTELMLLIGAAFPVTLLYALYVVTTGAALSFTTLAVPIGLFAAFAAAHIGVRIFAPGADPAILPMSPSRSWWRRLPWSRTSTW